MEEKIFTATAMVLPRPWKQCNFFSITVVVPRLYQPMIWRNKRCLECDQKTPSKKGLLLNIHFSYCYCIIFPLLIHCGLPVLAPFLQNKENKCKTRKWLLWLHAK